MVVTWIAELRVTVVHPDGRREPGHIAVGQPYRAEGRDAASREARCPIEITGVYSHEFPILGGGTLQALLAGVQTLGVMLHDFVAGGGRVLHLDDSEVPLEALFGPLLQSWQAATASD